MNSPAEPTLQQRLLADSQLFIDFVDTFSEEDFFRHEGDKWSVADVTQHLYLSARPVLKLMTSPREVFLQWGKTDAPARTYDQLATEYAQVLSTGLKAPIPFVPRSEDMQTTKSVVLERFVSVYQGLVKAVDQWSDEELDSYCMPHPVLGKLTVREMLHFVSVHTHHHLRLLKA